MGEWEWKAAGVPVAQPSVCQASGWPWLCPPHAHSSPAWLAFSPAMVTPTPVTCDDISLVQVPKASCCCWPKGTLRLVGSLSPGKNTFK